MKKSIALVLAVILLVGIIGTALACSHNNWHQVNTYTTSTKQTIAKTHGCIKLSNPHTHGRYNYVTKTTYVCFTCGDTKTIRSTSSGPEHCPKD